MVRPVHISWGATVLGLVVLVVAWHSGLSTDLGNLVILTFTFIAIVWYTHFTYRLLVKREEASVAATIHYVRETRDVRVLVSNVGRRFAAARVRFHIRVDGQHVIMPTAYAGQIVWNLTPTFTINGHFYLQKDVLDHVGKNYDAMKQAATDTNRTEQLQLVLEVAWTDEEGKPGSYPPHAWYFDFSAEDFVYHVGGFTDFP